MGKRVSKKGTNTLTVELRFDDDGNCVTNVELEGQADGATPPEIVLHALFAVAVTLRKTVDAGGCRCQACIASEEVANKTVALVETVFGADTGLTDPTPPATALH